MTAAHTPGPWVVNPIQLDQICSADASVVIARAMILHPAASTIANARLMASAPELLGMLIELLDAMGDCDSEIENAARAAIAKATGEAE
jgi:hypothetical protein